MSDRPRSGQLATPDTNGCPLPSRVDTSRVMASAEVADTTAKKIAEIISQQASGLTETSVFVSPETKLSTLYEMGVLDSLSIVEIVLAMEETFEIDIWDDEVARFERDREVTVQIVADRIDEMVREARKSR